MKQLVLPFCYGLTNFLHRMTGPLIGTGTIEINILVFGMIKGLHITKFYYG